MRGCEEEGLYRVPGSAQQVRYYERKFDEGKIVLIATMILAHLSHRPRHRLDQRPQLERPKRHRLTVQELAPTTARRDLPKGSANSDSTRMPGRQDDTANAQG